MSPHQHSTPAGRCLCILLAANAFAAPSAGAAFSGFVTETALVAPGRIRTKVYARFTNASDTLLNAYHIHAVVLHGGASGLGTGNFWHVDFLNGNVTTTIAGTWNPALLLGPNTNLDSWVTIGGEPASFANSTTADPGWGASGFNQPGIPDTAVAGIAGWYNGNPPNLQGRGVTFGPGDFRTLAGSFVMEQGSGVTVTLTVGFNQGLGTPTEFGNGTVLIGQLPVVDSDGDGVPDGKDNCPAVANPEQDDPDSDGVGSACDNCPGEANPGQSDPDCNGVGSECDCPGDADGDGRVDAEDITTILVAWGTCGGCCPADRNLDGLVDAEDLGFVLGYWMGCP